MKKLTMLKIVATIILAVVQIIEHKQDDNKND